MSVNSTDNKGLLWQLLSKHPNQKSDPKKFQSVLEYRVTEMHKNRFKFSNNLMSMNKEIIKQFAQEVRPTRTTKPPQAPISKGQDFEKKLKAQQNNFNKSDVGKEILRARETGLYEAETLDITEKLAKQNAELFEDKSVLQFMDESREMSRQDIIDMMNELFLDLLLFIPFVLHFG